MAPVVHYTQEDLNLIPLLNLVAEPIAGSATPSVANVGRLYRNTATGRLEFVLNATTVTSLPYSGGIADADIAGAANIALSKLATNPLARSNHTGTQLAATISDFISTVTGLTLNQLAAPTAALQLGGQKVSAMADAVANTDATTLQQVTNLLSSAINGHDWKDSARIAVSTNVTLTAPGATLDGVTMAAGDRVLLVGQTLGQENGMYIWNGASSTMTRSVDANTSAMVTVGMTMAVEQGSKASSMAILTTQGAITLGTTPLAFTFIQNSTAYTGGTGITVAANVISLPTVSIALGGTGATTAAAARTALGIGRSGFAQDVPVISAGSSTAITHGFATSDVTIDVYRKSDGATVQIAKARTDTNTVTLSADVAVAAGTLRVLINPLA